MKKLLDKITTINSKLPQLQCKKCGYPSCFKYASSIIQNNEKTNRCSPGGNEIALILSRITKNNEKTLNTTIPIHKKNHIAVIDESMCIGCTLCIASCPVDAIIGGAKKAHTVINKYCTGCELCIAPCPVNCINITPIKMKISQNLNANSLAERFNQKKLRLLELKRKKNISRITKKRKYKLIADAIKNSRLKKDIKSTVR